MDKKVYEFISTRTGDSIVEWKTCTVSGEPFAIFQSDVDFYQQVSPTFGGKKYTIPAPTLCPEERQRRRLAIRHETCLYSRECDLTGKKLVTAYSPDKPYKVYDHTLYRTDKWNPTAFFIRYDPSKKFFEQFDALLHQVPRISLLTDLRNENSLYVDQANLVRSSYMIWAAGYDEFCYYSYRVWHSNYVVDSSFVTKVEHSYECVECDGCYNCKYSVKCNDCADSSFLYNCKNCKNCFFCENLVNVQYYFFGKQYSKEEYELMIKQYDLSSYTTVTELKKKFDELVHGAIHKATDNVNSDGCFGHLTHRSKNVVRGFSCWNMEDSKYCFLYAEALKCMDVDYRGIQTEQIYESITIGDNAFNACFCTDSWKLQNCFYCDTCINCKNCFGCIGLNGQEYHIFNKQYTREDYEKLVPQIIEKMLTDGERGEFFPVAISTLGYNETPAQVYYPMTKEEALARGYKRSDYESPPQHVQAAVKASSLPDTIGEVSPETKEMVVECEVTGKAFRVTPQELDFYRSHKIPLPRRHFDIRRQDRMRYREPLQLYLRTCDNCSQETLSVYPQKSEYKVYCQVCYDKKVYG